MIANKQIDAFGIWEPAVELGAPGVGQQRRRLPELLHLPRVYSLYSTQEKLADPATRKNIVAFVKALKPDS